MHSLMSAFNEGFEAMEKAKSQQKNLEEETSDKTIQIV